MPAEVAKLLSMFQSGGDCQAFRAALVAQEQAQASNKEESIDRAGLPKGAKETVLAIAGCASVSVEDDKVIRHLVLPCLGPYSHGCQKEVLEVVSLQQQGAIVEAMTAVCLRALCSCPCEEPVHCVETM
jgi:hypothetical protein